MEDTPAFTHPATPEQATILQLMRRVDLLERDQDIARRATGNRKYDTGEIFNTDRDNKFVVHLYLVEEKWGAAVAQASSSGPKSGEALLVDRVFDHIVDAAGPGDIFFECVSYMHFQDNHHILQHESEFGEVEVTVPVRCRPPTPSLQCCPATLRLNG